MDTLRQSEDYSWDFGEEPSVENEVELDPSEATYEQMMSDGAPERMRLAIWAFTALNCLLSEAI
jgi:hypothetical protein